MPSPDARPGRFSGPGVTLLLLQMLALLSLGLAAAYFHHRLGLLLEPLSDACGGEDPAARLHVAEHLLTRAAALDHWRPLRWIPMATMCLSLLAATALCAGWRYRSRSRSAAGLRAIACVLMALHGLVLALTGWTLYLYEDAWASIATMAPSACLVDFASHGDPALQQAEQLVRHLLTRTDAPLPGHPDRLVMLLAVLILLAMAGGLLLWRAAWRNARR